MQSVTIAFISTITFCSKLYGADVSLQIDPEDSHPVTVTFSDEAITVYYPDGKKQVLLDKQALGKALFAEHNNQDSGDLLFSKDFNQDGYKDLAVHVGKDKRGLHHEYQFFYWNHTKSTFDLGQVFVNPQLEKGFLIEHVYGYLYRKNRYRWNNYHFQLHSKLTMLDEKRTEVTFYQSGKAVKTLTVASEKVDEVTNSWDD